MKVRVDGSFLEKVDKINYFFAIANGYPKNELGLIHPEFMTQFVDAMAYTLYRWDRNHGTGGNMDWQYYLDMAWGGLINYPDPHDRSKSLFYDEFNSYINSLDDPNTSNNEGFDDKNRIMETVENEAENTSGSSQGGDESSCL